MKTSNITEYSEKFSVTILEEIVGGVLSKKADIRYNE